MRRGRRAWSGYFRWWLKLKGWGWGPHAQCRYATLPVGDHGWRRIG